MAMAKVGGTNTQLSACAAVPHWQELGQTAVPNHQPAKFLPLGYSQPKTMYVCFHCNVLLLKVRCNISNTLLPAEICRNVDYFLNMKHVEHCRTIRLPWLSLIASVRCEGFSRDIPPNQGFWWYPASC